VLLCAGEHGGLACFGNGLEQRLALIDDAERLAQDLTELVEGEGDERALFLEDDPAHVWKHHAFGEKPDGERFFGVLHRHDRCGSIALGLDPLNPAHERKNALNGLFGCFAFAGGKQPWADHALGAGPGEDQRLGLSLDQYPDRGEL